MASYNKVLLMGNLTRDIEVRHTPSNMAVGNFAIACNRKWRDQAGAMQEEVTFVDCEAWGKTAENMAKFLQKGRPVFIEGRLKLDSWQDKTDGSKRSKMKVVVESFEFIDSKAGGGPGGGGGDGENAGYSPSPRPAANRPAPARGPSSQPAAQSYEQIQEDDIPF